mmetsp:Transcript_65571/g.77638  ORF Transcript_65571/g.77638 Transcript_65571/m.77638 type:complete len:510 (+) Transcript_65571:107-1636(+)|eukprot:CAMPEP_0172509570 /NCGR_PEP_ID=MMETSP1066-20121228/221322_1 /TAXON_ID=671091 /ORGANISM="Coscinodiscus wailesii, Strain CCMP2513" /LENGTH=509 /DNA_ID=CAMNT_0013288123 /DNA_START=94 /DNA_END=1623 /DNA_ORIENTATION=+
MAAAPPPSSAESTSHKNDATNPPVVEATVPLKDPPPQSQPQSQAATVASSPSTGTIPTSDATIPTYKSIKSSPSYKKAKEFLNAGDFEEALTLLSTTLSELITRVETETHPSAAPLYYLYGTTLLYSVEESTDDAMLQQQQQSSSSDDPESESQVQQQQHQAQVQSANDIEIAWENLESARSIVAKMPEMTTDRDVSLDLAQIHVRLGDLQRMNGNYGESVQDYSRGLEMRRKILGLYDRSVADCHYNLGLAYLMRAAEGVEGEGGVGDAERQDMKDRSMRHYLSCGRAFAGLIAQLCGATPADIVGNVDEDEDDDMEKKPSADAPTPANASSNTYSSLLQQIRDKVASLKPSQPADSQTVHEWKELLDEIQETIDASDESVRVLKDVSQLKKQAESDILKADNDDAKAALQQALKSSLSSQDGKKPATAAAGPTTTIGFGAVATAGAASTAASTAAPMAVNMMVAKKKKKRADLTPVVPPQDAKKGEDKDSTAAVPQEPAAKRLKSSE